MYIHIDKGESPRKRGFVADYCAVCQMVTCCRMWELRESMRIWGMPVSQGKLTGYRLQCQTCQNGVMPTADLYENHVKKRKTPIEDLIEETNPAVFEYMEGREEWIDRLIEGELDDESTVVLATRMLAEFNPAYERALRNKQVNPVSITLIFATLAVLIMTMVIAAGQTNTNLPVIPLRFAIAALIATAALALIIIPFTPRRFAKRALRGPINNAFGILPFTAAQLEQALYRLRVRRKPKIRLARHISVEWVQYGPNDAVRKDVERPFDPS